MVRSVREPAGDFESCGRCRLAAFVSGLPIW